MASTRRVARDVDRIRGDDVQRMWTAIPSSLSPAISPHVGFPGSAGVGAVGWARVTYSR